MIVAPCSVRTLAEIASGVTSSLLSRAADVCLKQRRRLVLMVRETPLHAGHLKTCSRRPQMGAIIMPPVPAFYTKPTTIAEIIDFTAARALDLFDIEVPGMPRWTGRPDNLAGGETDRWTTSRPSDVPSRFLSGRADRRRGWRPRIRKRASRHASRRALRPLAILPHRCRRACSTNRVAMAPCSSPSSSMCRSR